jgi:hypothetical protein
MKGQRAGMSIRCRPFGQSFSLPAGSEPVDLTRLREMPLIRVMPAAIFAWTERSGQAEIGQRATSRR